MNNVWKGDNYKFVGKAFEAAYANRLNRLKPVIHEVDGNSVDYTLAGSGGFGEMQPYDGTNLNQGEQKRGFTTVITPGEFTKTMNIGFKQAKVDKNGECRKTGSRLGDAAALTVYLHVLRMFAGAFDPKRLGGDGKPWASEDHPVAAMMSEGRKYIPDPESGTYSNLMKDVLSVAAITKAQTMANRFITPDGAPMLSQFDTVLVSPEDEGKAKKMFGESAKLRPTKNPDDNSNAANPVHDMNYIVVGGGNDGFKAGQWAVCDKTQMLEICKLVYITRPQVMRMNLDNPLIDSFTGYVDFGTGWGDGRPIIFSNPI